MTSVLFCVNQSGGLPILHTPWCITNTCLGLMPGPTPRLHCQMEIPEGSLNQHVGGVPGYSNSILCKVYAKFAPGCRKSSQRGPRWEKGQAEQAAGHALPTRARKCLEGFDPPGNGFGVKLGRAFGLRLSSRTP